MSANSAPTVRPLWQYCRKLCQPDESPAARRVCMGGCAYRGSTVSPLPGFAGRGAGGEGLPRRGTKRSFSTRGRLRPLTPAPLPRKAGGEGNTRSRLLLFLEEFDELELTRVAVDLADAQSGRCGIAVLVERPLADRPIEVLDAEAGFRDRGPVLFPGALDRLERDLAGLVTVDGVSFRLHLVLLDILLHELFALARELIGGHAAEGDIALECLEDVAAGGLDKRVLKAP